MYTKSHWSVPRRDEAATAAIAPDKTQQAGRTRIFYRGCVPVVMATRVYEARQGKKLEREVMWNTWHKCRDARAGASKTNT